MPEAESSNRVQTTGQPERWWLARLPRCAADPAASAFFAGLEARGLSRNTLIAYGRAIESLIEFAGPLDELRVDAGLVHRFLAFLRSVKVQAHGREAAALSPSTVRQRMVGLRAYADQLVDAGRLDHNPVARGSVGRTRHGHVVAVRRGLVPVASRLPRLPSDDEWTRLVAALQSRPPRDKLMFMLAYDGALRRAELVTLRLDDFDFSTRQITIRPECSKNGYGRTVLYSPATGQVLATYLADRRRLHVGKPFVFLSASPRNRSEPIGGFTWGLLATALAREAGVSGFSTHTLRHLRLTDLARAGLDITEIATFAGHRSTESTLLYIHLSGRDLTRAFQRAAPRLVDRFARP
ncbi:MAG TPA: tyrosine-type recombinase/integrase [Stellaceae bacterium]|nr:tyrosine-type recombinase/integrase [Stellaceae bacterium]